MILLIVGFVYLLFVSFLVLLWVFYPLQNSMPVEAQSISIIVPFKNEEEALPELVSSINALIHEKDFEVIFVDDNSTDGSLTQIPEQSNFTVLSNKKNGKKGALSTGVEVAVNDWIWQIDADVMLHPYAFEAMWHFVKPDTRVVLGPVGLIHSKADYRPWLQITEWILLQWVTALSTLFRIPFLANGANMMFRKEVFKAYSNSGYGADYSSGDDVFLMNHVRKNHGAKSIRYAKSSFAIAYTKMSSSFDEFSEQRKRWLGKMEDRSLSQGKFFKWVFIFFPLLLLLSFVLTILGKQTLELFLGGLFVMIAWTSFLGYVLGVFWNQPKLLLWLVPFFFVYPFKLRKALK